MGEGKDRRVAEFLGLFQELSELLTDRALRDADGPGAGPLASGHTLIDQWQGLVAQRGLDLEHAAVLIAQLGPELLCLTIRCLLIEPIRFFERTVEMQQAGPLVAFGGVEIRG